MGRTWEHTVAQATGMRVPPALQRYGAVADGTNTPSAAPVQTK